MLASLAQGSSSPHLPSRDGSQQELERGYEPPGPVPLFVSPTFVDHEFEPVAVEAFLLQNRHELARVAGLSRPEAGRGNRALVAEGFATMLSPGAYRMNRP